MKTILTIAICLLSLVGNAQNWKITMTKSPCNADGILVLDGLDPQFHSKVFWTYRGGNDDHAVTGKTDQLDKYPGGYCGAYIYDLQDQYIGYASFSSNLPFTADVDFVPNTCPQPGLATAVINGGKAPYTYEWRNESKNVVSNTNPGQIFESGSYEVTIKDANGCVVTLGSNYDSLEFRNDAGFTYEIKTTEANCTNGTAEVIGISGGQAPFSYEWFNGATTNSIGSLRKGVYDVKIKDGQGCISKSSVFINQAKEIFVNTVKKEATCSNKDGELEAFASGGTPPYQYTWKSGEKTQKISNLSPGNYVVEVLDTKQCSGMGYFYIESRSPVNASILSISPSSCTIANGTAEISISGGTPPYKINWNTNPVQKSTTLTNVIGGNYTFQVVDANNCARSGIVNIPFESIINLSIQKQDETCNNSDGALNVQASGGTPPYSYKWEDGSTTNSRNNLKANSYGLSVSDSKLCITQKNLVLHKNSPLVISFSTKEASCIYSHDGEITASVIGGTPPYTFVWPNGSTNQTIQNLYSGYYAVQVLDALGCSGSNYVELTYNHFNDNCYCTLTGTVYYDANQNCIQDPGDYPIPNIPIRVSKYGTYFSNSNGVYNIKVPTGKYLLYEFTNEAYPLASCQNNDISINVVAASGCIITNDFGNSINPIHDAEIYSFGKNGMVPGFVFEGTTIVRNNGTIVESGFISKIKDDGQIGLRQMQPSNIFNSIGQNTYEATNFGTLNPTDYQVFDFNYSIPANIPLNTKVWFDDLIAFKAPYENWRNDNTPWNNLTSYYCTTAGSFDPNNIQVIPQGKGETGLITPEDSVLTYKVQFQNEGNYYTQFVKVNVNLDKNLDWKSVTPVYASHPGILNISETGQMTYTFDPIRLYPKDWDEALSSGFFIFHVKLNRGLAVGTTIKSNAAIYFDYNKPVETNITLNTINKSLVNTKDIHAPFEIDIYPNPNSGIFNLPIISQSIDDMNIEIINILGQKVYHKSIRVIDGWQNLLLNLENNEAGTYFLKASNKKGDFITRKFEIVK